MEGFEQRGHVEMVQSVGFDKKADVAGALVGIRLFHGGVDDFCAAITDPLYPGDHRVSVRIGNWADDAESVDSWAGGDQLEEWNGFHEEQLGTWREFLTETYRDMATKSFAEIATVDGCDPCDEKVDAPDMTVGDDWKPKWN